MSNYVLIRVKRQMDDQRRIELYIEGTRNASYAPPISGTDRNNYDLNEIQLYEVRSTDADAAVLQLTKERPGCEVCTYVLVGTAIRPAGEIVHKKITKEGVLPF